MQMENVLMTDGPLPMLGFEGRLEQFRRVFKSGSFVLESGNRILDALRAAAVPNAYGVYVISTMTSGRSEVVYIGKAGTLSSSGKWSDQGLEKRLRNKQERMPRQEYFKKLLAKGDCGKLNFEWFVTVDAEGPTMLPALAENLLLQEYLREQNQLPAENKKV